MTDASQRLDLPVGSIGRHANGWWGMMMLIVTEAALFVYLLFAYYYAAVQHERNWLPEDLPNFKLSLPDTIILLLSSLVVWRGESLLKQGRRGGVAAVYLAVAAVMGIVFIAIQALEWGTKAFTPFLEFLRVALLHHHRLSHDACRRGRHRPGDPLALVRARLLQSHTQRARQHRRHLLALRRRRLARALLHLLHHAAAGTRLKQ